MMMNFLNQLCTWAGEIPATFWGVVIGSFFSLSGVWMANRANDRRLREQLAHDREMRTRDRELSLRKDVYLSAAEAISAGITAVGRFANLEIPDNKVLETYTDKSPAIAKAHTIANERTIQLLTNFLVELNAAYLRLFAKRFPLIVKKNQISFLQKQIDRSSQERDRMLELMKQFNLEGSTDQRRWEVINSNFKFEGDLITEASKERDMLTADLMMKELQLIKECVEETNKLGHLTVPVIASARAELEMPVDEQTLTQITEQGIKKQEANLEAFMENIRSLSIAQQSTAIGSQKSGS